MPLYEYLCDSCGHRFEVIQKFSDPHTDTCSKCGGTVRRLLSSPAIQFKGSGWYITDYARKPPAGGEKGAPAGESKPTDASASPATGTSTSDKASGSAATPPSSATKGD